MSAGPWTLDHDAAALDAAAQAWVSVADSLTGTADDVNAAATTTLGSGWEGLSAEGYAAHRSTLLGDVDTGATLAQRAAQSLTAVASSVRSAQARLDASWASVASVEHTVAGDTVSFQPEDDAEELLVTAAMDEATAVRDGLDATLQGDLVELDTIASEWSGLAAAWEAAAAGESSFEVPDDGDETGILVVDGVAYVSAGKHDDEIETRIDPDTGETIVTVNGVDHVLPDGAEVVIRGGTGDDTIVVKDGVHAGVTVLAGHGDDDVTGGSGSDVVVGGRGADTIVGGEQRDRIFGSAGQDYLDGQDDGDLVDGGLDHDTVYGLGGRDDLSGGEGDDYVEGGESADVVDGGAGDDVVSGGLGDDTVLGGSGSDVAYAGRGDDTVHGGDGTDTAYAEQGDDVTSAVHQEVTIPDDLDIDDYVDIQGSPEYQERVRADLELLASSPNGQELLAGLRDGLEGSDDGTVVIREPVSDEGPAFHDPNGEGRADYVVGYDPTHDTLRGYTPPSVVLGHELAHLYDDANGIDDDLGTYEGEEERDVGEREEERVATGLPIDHDDNPDTPEQIHPDHPVAATEEGLRDEMGLPPRGYYDGDESDG
ncbi:MAG: M91 family zinc metallopeptidase [Aeromicrobium sp.]